MTSKPHVIVYTDGGSVPNPGTGGWAAILISGVHKKELKGGEPPYTTNNRMELMAVIAALEALKKPSLVDLHTDSQYVHRGISEYIHNWKRKGWITAARTPVKNDDLWRRLDAAVMRHEVKWHWVRGHAGNEFNERADHLVGEAIAEVRATGRAAAK